MLISPATKVNRNATRTLQLGAWALSSLVVALSIINWGSSYKWQLGHLTTYQLFPVLGLIAFSLMWSHYIASVARDLMKLPRAVLVSYFNWTSYVVLAAICLHPGLLIYQRFRDGYGTPPHSYESYVAPGLGWVTVLGSACLLVFLCYEFRRRFANRSWWRFVNYAVDLAMLGILYHGLRLGDQLQHGWLKTVWYIYGITLLACLVYTYSKRLRSTPLAAVSGQTKKKAQAI
jgi:hypothetical protein